MKWLIGVALILVILLASHRLLLVPDGGAEPVENGLREFTICGKARTSSTDPFMNPLANRIMEATGKGTGRGARVGSWSLDRQADCDVYYHSVWNTD
jgi:hypothetical protein